MRNRTVDNPDPHHWRGYLVAVLLWLLFLATAIPAHGQELRRCDLAPQLFPSLTPHVPSKVFTPMLPRLADGTPVPWGTPGAYLGMVWSGHSDAAQEGGAVGRRLQGLIPAAMLKQIKFISVAQSGKATRQWMNPNDPAWANAAQRIAAAGLTPAQVGVWMQSHAVLYWAQLGKMRTWEVEDVHAIAQMRYPYVGLFVDTDLTDVRHGFAFKSPGVLLEGGTSVDGDVYPPGTLLGHPSTIAVASDTTVLAEVAEKPGTNVEYVQMADFPLQCETEIANDGVHYTSAGAATTGTETANRMWPVLRQVLGL